jgi:peptidase C25-like protein
MIRLNAHRSLAVAAALVTGAIASVSAEPLAEITVTERGVHAVRAWDFEEAGLDLEGLLTEEIGVTCLGARQACVIEDLDDNGLFDGADRLIFFGQRLRDERVYRYRHADENIYLLERWPEDEVPPLEPRPAALGPTHARPCEAPVGIQRNTHFEEDRFWSGRFGYRGEELSTDFSFWGEVNFLRGVTREFTFNLPGVDSRADSVFSLTISLFGRSAASQGRNQGVTDHSLAVELNGEQVGLIEFDGQTKHTAVLDGLDPGLLRARDNLLALSLNRREDVPIDVIYIDWYEIQASIRPVMTGGQMEITLPGPSAEGAFSVEGLTSSDVYLFCLTTNTMLPVDVERDMTGTHTVSFTARCDDGIYAIAQGQDLIEPAGVAPFAPVFELEPEEGAEYVIISHPNFLEAAERLAAHRAEHDGLSTLVVDIEDIYTLFNHGVVHPEALRDGIEHMFTQWPEPTLRYVLLLGDASWDHHCLTSDLPTFIPTHYWPNHQGEYSSDSHFVDFGENERPEVALGRLPVKTAEEAMGVVDKIITYEEQIAADDPDNPAAWRHRIIFTASDRELYRNFLDEAVEEHIEGNFDLRRAYASNASPIDCTQQVVDAFNDGVAFVSYVGHGARYVWQTGTTLANSAADYEANFNPERVDELFNVPMLPIVFGITCFTNNFDNPAELNCIGEKLILSPEGGAVAVLATSSYSYIHSDLAFCDLLFETLFEAEEPLRVGDLVLQALQKPRVGRDVRRMFLLLGDPASQVPLVPLPGAQREMAEEEMEEAEEPMS